MAIYHFVKDKIDILKLNCYYRNMSFVLGLTEKESESYKLGQRV